MISNTELPAALARRFSHVALNPQPLPPKTAHAAPGSNAALNPQPLPPRSLLSAFSRAFSGVTHQAPASDRGIIIVGGRQADAGSDRGIIIVGGRSVLPSALKQRGIIVVGG